MTNANTSRINELLSAVTAMSTLEQLREFQELRGYVPTLRHAPGSSRSTVTFNAQVDELRELLKAEGLRVWPE